MAITRIDDTPGTLPVGDVWVLCATIADVDGVPVDVAPVVTVTLPGGTTVSPTAESVTTGTWRATYTLAGAGRHVATMAGVDGIAVWTVHATAVVTAAGMPDLDAVKEYLDISIGDTSRDTELSRALAAEAAAQRDMCRIPADYPPSLAEALLRRVARNLAMSLLPLAVLRGDGEAGDTILPGRDPEVRRLEAPHRRRRVG